MNVYLLKRVGAFALVFIGLELLASFAWFLLHAGDRRVIEETAPRIEALSAELAGDQEWLARRTAFGAGLDALAERVRAGGAGFETRAGFDSARTLHVERVETWNAGIPEHERRVARADSLAGEHDGLVARYEAAYRRAFPGWLLMPRPARPRQTLAR